MAGLLALYDAIVAAFRLTPLSAGAGLLEVDTGIRRLLGRIASL